MHLRSLKTVALLTCLGCLNEPSRPLAQTKVADTFTFATTRSVNVTVNTDASALPPGGFAKLRITRTDGKILFEGPFAAQRPVVARLPLPTKDHQLIATIVESGKHAAIDVDADNTSYTFH